MLVTGAGRIRAAASRASPTAVRTHTLQQVAVVVEALLAVTLVPGLRVHTLALFADLCPEQYALVDVCVTKESVSAPGQAPA